MNLINRNIYLFLLVLLASCNKNLLDTAPTDRLAVNIFWKTEADAKLAVNALYQDLDSTNIIALDALTDIGHTNQNFDVQAYIELGTYDQSSAKVYGEWKNAYKGIHASNYFLENVDKITVVTPALISQFKGEAKTLRAYQYIKLAGLYGDVPLVTTSITLEQARSLKRTPVSEIYDFIDKELTEAAALLPASYAAADKGRITRGAAWALKARADLFAGRYQLAADAATQVNGLGYTLYESYQKLFSYAAENNKEVILDKQFIKDNYPNNVFSLLAPYSQKNGNSSYVPTRVLADTYQTANGKGINDNGSNYDPAHPYDNRDPRLKYSLFTDGDVLPSGQVFHPAPNSGTADAIGSTYIASTTGYNLKKYVNAEDYVNPTNCGINIILLRYAEVLLTYAEAKIELNQLDQTVYNAINTVRQRADVNMPALPVGLTQSQLRAAVRYERTVELAFEGLRLYDIRRWKTAETVMTGPVYGITWNNNGQPVTVQVVSFNRAFDKSRHYLWPVPQKERDLDPALSQNPNW
ncbi:MAG: RagB/SusD family nutrient uptake outer membrane protein [Chitinophaga sp.]|uniref:RagB/SusD family nutrient uptake outer membrane protein n=1 Tax=Chitinophaga sp. TaxID=1869181 RepID=UPI001AFFC2DA|nr:RagB/SusD family nutrient uptake outer membrane protein [Chitinophaga sp.]MBO9727277.1 RagB/SusD family nutrient uptake outer membrane protein [Chitinophaga sp.]